MKHLVFTACLILGVSFISSSQNFGILFGANYSTLDGPELQESGPGFSGSETWEPRLGFQGGLVFEVDISSRLALRTGMTTTQQGGRYITTFSYVDEEFQENYTEELEVDFIMTSIEIPLALKINITNENLKLYAIGGGSMSVGMAAKGKYKSTLTATFQGESFSESDSSTESMNYGTGGEEELNRFNFGLMGGVGVQKNNLFADLSYYFGLTNLTSDESFDLAQRSIVLSLGVFVNKKD